MGNIQSIRKSLKKNLLIEGWDDDEEGDSPWESLYMSHFRGINEAARRMGIDINSARLVNTKRPNMAMGNIKDVADGARQWYSMGTAWLDWIQGNMPDWLAPHTYALEFTSTPLIINGKNVLRMFEQKYVIDPQRPKDMAINWDKLYKHGVEAVEFNPYNRGLSGNFSSMSWYGSIDMSSGVVVNKKIIGKIVKLYDGTDDFRDAGVKI
jgi:hypothetical protein